MPVDWTACEQDVINEYVNGTKTAKETLQHIRQVHGVHATLRQFKWKFGGKKKLRADEWKVVISKIREREAEGKTSAVYLHGRRLPPDRVAREMRRYSKNCEVKNSDGIYLGVDTIDEHRLEIRDPEAPCSQLTIRASSNVPRGLTGFTMAQNLQELENPTGTTDWGIDPAFAVPVDFMDLDLSTPQLQDSPGFQIAHPQSPHNLSSLDLQRNRSSPTPCRAEMTPGAMVRTESCSSRRAQFHSPSEGPSFQIFPATSTIVAGSAEPLFPPFWDSKEITTLIPAVHEPGMLSIENEICVVKWNELRSRILPGNSGYILSHLMSVDPKLEVLGPAARFIEELTGTGESFFSRRSSQTRIQLPIPDNVSQQLLTQIFSVVVYLISNKLLESRHIQVIVEWARDKGLSGKLSAFLQSKLEYTRSCADKLLQHQDFELERAKCSPSFGNLLDRGRLISVAKRCGWPDRLSWVLFRQVIDSDNVGSARILVSSGANVNCSHHHCSPRTCDKRPSEKKSMEHNVTPLLYAIKSGSEAMISYLISAGAEDLGIALLFAMTLSRFEMVDFLLRKTKGIYINPEVRTYDVLEHVKATWPEEYEGIRGKLSNAYAFQVFELIEAADQGNISLAKLVLRFGINQRDLEECLYEAVKTGKSMAVATLLQRGVDPNARRYRLINKVGDPEGVEKSHPVKLALELGKNSKQGLDIIYLLIKAGADVNDELLVECGEVAAELEHPEFILLLSQRGYDAALFGLPLLSRVILDGSIYQCGPFLDAGVPISAYSTKYTFYVEDHNDDIWGPMSALQVAIFQGDLALVKYLVSRGGDVNLPAHDDSGRTTLQAAAERNRFDVVKWLVNAGADVKAPPAIHDGMTVLEAVAVSRDGKEVDPMFKYLLALGAPVNRPDGASGSVLHDLIRASRHECLGLVLDAGARVDSQEEFSGLTPLQVASERSDIEAVSMLLSHGSDINACAANEPRGRTALQAAAGTFCNVEAVVEFLLQKGADVNAPGSAVHGRTALQAAAEASSIEIVELLLRNGADVNAPAATEHGCTALQAAVRRSKIDTVELLLQNGADVNAPGSAVRGRTALQTAIETSSVEVVELLLQNGANVNTPATTEYGRTALQAATSSYHPDSRVVALLISSGADINAGPSAKGGVTALQGAAINGDLQIARILLHHGADVNADRSPDEGRTAVEGAAERGRLEMVRLLLSAGAMPDPVDGFLTAIKLADKNEHYAIGDLLEKFVESGQFLFTGSNDWLDENFYSSFAA